MVVQPRHILATPGTGALEASVLGEDVPLERGRTTELTGALPALPPRPQEAGGLLRLELMMQDLVSPQRHFGIEENITGLAGVIGC